MNNIIEIINKLDGLLSLEEVKDFDIIEAENTLKCKFSESYKEYLRNFGVITFGDTEIMGICPSKRLNVVDVTLSERSNNPSFPKDMYIIENTGFDSVFILQNSQGEIFEMQQGKTPKKIHNSLEEYLSTYL